MQPAPFNKPRSWEKESASERTFDKQDRYKARHHFVFNEVKVDNGRKYFWDGERLDAGGDDSGDSDEDGDENKGFSIQKGES